jgi:hypothetical protein
VNKTYKLEEKEHTQASEFKPTNMTFASTPVPLPY